MKWCRALCERSEFARPRDGVSGSVLEEPGWAKWFWALLPKQKGLGCRAEPRQDRCENKKSCFQPLPGVVLIRWGGLCPVSCPPVIPAGRWQESFFYLSLKKMQDGSPPTTAGMTEGLIFARSVHNTEDRINLSYAGSAPSARPKIEVKYK